MKALIGKKVGMTQIFTADGNMAAVTAIQVTPNVVVGHRTKEKEGYSAALLGIREGKRVTKPLAGQVKKTGVTESINRVREFRTTEELSALATTLDVSVFTPGEYVDVSGVSKGKGFAGVIKRHGFSQGPETHGSDHHRAPGSIGSAFPQRVVKGKKMPGHLGSDRVTIKKLQVIEIHPEHNLLLIKGAVPGAKGSLIEIRGSNG